MIYRTQPRLEVLLGRRADTGQWDHVAGIVEPGEHPAETIVREALEEFGVQIEVERMIQLLVGDEMTYANGDRCQYLDHSFVSRWCAGHPWPADGEATEVAWFSPDALPADAPARLTRLVSLGLGPAQPVAFQ
ncbi:MAG: NUDIX domain-containing protein [Propionibacteriaceae bacterium]|nr:NUDIX domain-containing protein [Propionibacteriaceae bacterium]